MIKYCRRQLIQYCLILQILIRLQFGQCKLFVSHKLIHSEWKRCLHES